MNEIEKKVKIGLWRQRIGYGSSDFACNLIWQMISLYLLYFYTNVMHLNAGAVSVMFLVTKVIDGISDLIVGFLIDKTNTKWGKSRPWILFGAIPFGVAAVLAFSVPNIGAALLQFGGFDANLAVQTTTAQSYITAMYIWVPIVMNVATIITMMFYNLDKIYPQIVKELDERRANA